MPHTSLAHKHAQQAILFALIAYAFYSTGDALVKILGTMQGIGVIMSVNGAIICTLSLLALAVQKKLHTVYTTPRLKLYLLRACIVGALVFLALTSLQHVPLPDFYGILFMSPYVVALFAHFILREEIGWHRMIAMVVGSVGVTILAGPHFTNMNPAYALVFLMLFIVAGHVLVVRKLGTEDPWPLLPLFPGFGMLGVGIPLLMMNPEWPRLDVLPLLIFYSLCIFLGQIAFSRAFTITPLMAIIAPYVYTQMLWGVFYSAVLFHEWPGMTTWIGAAIVIASGAGNLLYERSLRRRHLFSARAMQRAARHPELASAGARATSAGSQTPSRS